MSFLRSLLQVFFLKTWIKQQINFLKKRMYKKES